MVTTIIARLYIAAEATLTFLGVGLQRPAISWGFMIAEREPYVLHGDRTCCCSRARSWS